MGDPFWPGHERAGLVFMPEAFIEAMVAVESAWVDAPLFVPHPELDAESGGNAAIALVAELRDVHPDLAERIHAGLTSQDVVDTALMMLAQDAVTALLGDVRRGLELLDGLASAYGTTPMLARTLTQPALPITVGHKVAAWRSGLAAAAEELDGLGFPVQAGGPVGLGLDGADALADRLDLDRSAPWHTARRPVTRIGDALVATTDALGRIARDVLELSRPEIGELSEGTGGGSSSMPHKHNPVLSVLIRRAALAAPMLGATLHLAAAEQVDERADGAWHVEWDTLRLLARRTVVAASQAADLLEGLRVHADRMAANLERWGPR